MITSREEAIAVAGQFISAANTNNAAAVSDLFHEDYQSDQPIYPSRSFIGKRQVFENHQKMMSNGTPKWTVLSTTAGLDPEVFKDCSMWRVNLETNIVMSNKTHVAVYAALIGRRMIDGPVLIQSVRLYHEPVHSGDQGSIQSAVDTHFKKSNLIAVVSTGQLAIATVQALLAQKKTHIRVIVRPSTSQDKVSALCARFPENVTVVTADVNDADSVGEALRGASAVVCAIGADMGIAFSGGDWATPFLQTHRAFADAAVREGVEQFIPSQFGLHPSLTESGLDNPLLAVKDEAASYVKSLGLKCTNIYTACFADPWFSPSLQFNPTQDLVTVYGPGSQKNGYVTVKNLGECVAACVMNERFYDVDLHVVGDVCSYAEIVRYTEETLGKTIVPTYQDVDQLRSQFQQLPAGSMFKAFVGLQLDIALGYGDKVAAWNTRQSFPDVQFESVCEYLKSNLKATA